MSFNYIEYIIIISYRSVKLVMVVLEFGGLKMESHIESVYLYRYIGSLDHFLLAAEVRYNHT